MRNAAVTVVVLLLAPFVAAQQPPNGEAIYKQHCASCHDGTLPRMPSREALRMLTPEHVDTALSSFSMRRQGATLMPAERRAVSEFVTGLPAGSYKAPLDAIAKSAYCSAGATSSSSAAPLAGAAWNGWGTDLRATRFQPAAAAGLSAADVPRLTLKWAFGFPGVSASGSQATVVGSRVFVGSRNGMVYALDAKTGCIVWTFQAEAGVRSTPVVDPAAAGGGVVYFGDAHAQVYGVSAANGALRWKTQVDRHLDALVTGGIAAYRGRLYVPVSSLEEGTAVIPTYQCCTFRGSVVSLDAATGKQIWKTYTIKETPRQTTKSSRGTQLWGPSGGGVWSVPVIDPDRNRVYIATGDSYSGPAAPESDAVMALAMDTGRVVWVQQTLAGDAWNVGCLIEKGAGVNCPTGAGPDHDFSSSPSLTVFPDGRRVLLAGQKSGTMFGLNPESGELIWKTQAGEGGVLGGIEWGFANDGATAYVSLSNAFEKKPGEAGGVVAVGIEDGKKRWSAPPPQNTCAGRIGCTTGQPAAVTVIPGVLFSGSLDGHLRAYDSATGRVIWDHDTVRDFETVNGVQARGGSMNGPGATIAGGMLFVNSGYGSLGFMAGNVLLAFAVEPR